MSHVYGAAAPREGSPHHDNDTHTMSDPLFHIASDSDVNPDLVQSVDGDDPSHIKSYQSDMPDEGYNDTYPLNEPRVCYCCTRKQRRWACLIGSVFTLTMIILFCVGWWVIIPYIAQKQVDSATISFGRLGLSNPSNTTFSINVTGALHSDIPFDATTDPTEMNIYYSYPDPSFNTTVLHSSNNSIPIPLIETLIGSVIFPSLTLASGTDVVPIQTQTTFNIKDEIGFKQFMFALVNSSSCTWRLRADLTIHAHLTSLITITIDGIHLDKEAVLQGMNGLVDANLTILDVDVVGGDTDSVWILPVLSINDTTDISMDMAPDGVTLSVFYPYNGTEVEIANATVADFHLYPGINEMSTVARIYAQSHYPDLVPALLSDYLGGHDSAVIVRGADNGVPAFPIMSEVLRSLRLPAILPGFQEPIILHAKSHLVQGWPFPTIMGVSLNVSNYWNVTLDLQACDVNVTYNGTIVGKATIDTFNPPVTVAAYTTAWTPFVNVNVYDQETTAINAMINDLLFGGAAYLGVFGTMTLAISPSGGVSPNPFVTTISYQQQQVKVTYG